MVYSRGLLLLFAATTSKQIFAFIANPKSYRSSTFLKDQFSPIGTVTVSKKDKAIDKNGEVDLDVGKSLSFDDVLRTRRTINNFEEELPEGWEEDIEKAIESAIQAPNHKRTEPWSFYLLGPETIKKICELNASMVSEKKGEKAGKKKLERWLKMPGWLVVTCRTSGDDTDMNKPMSLAREDYAACASAVQNLCLSLHNSGLGTKWTSGGVNFSPYFNEILELEKDEFCVGTMWFGTPKEIPTPPVKKRALKDVLVHKP